MMNNPHHNRFKDAPWYPKKETPVLVGGAGGIGSWLSLLLTRAGFNPVIYDFDMLEEHNLGGQLFPKRYIGRAKVEALHDVIVDFTNVSVVIMREKMNEFTPSNNIVFSAFDNMKARCLVFSSWQKNFGNDPEAIFIDGRLTAEQMQIFCVKGGDTEKQNEYTTIHLFDDSTVEDAPCTMKQTSHAAAMIAAHMTGFFTNHYTNSVEKDNTRAVPFKWEYFIPMDLLEVIN